MYAQVIPETGEKLQPGGTSAAAVKAQMERRIGARLLRVQIGMDFPFDGKVELTWSDGNGGPVKCRVGVLGAPPAASAEAAVAALFAAPDDFGTAAAEAVKTAVAAELPRAPKRGCVVTLIYK